MHEALLVWPLTTWSQPPFLILLSLVQVKQTFSPSPDVSAAFKTVTSAWETELEMQTGKISVEVRTENLELGDQ